MIRLIKHLYEQSDIEELLAALSAGVGAAALWRVLEDLNERDQQSCLDALSEVRRRSLDELEKRCDEAARTLQQEGMFESVDWLMWACRSMQRSNKRLFDNTVEDARQLSFPTKLSRCKRLGEMMITMHKMTLATVGGIIRRKLSGEESENVQRLVEELLVSSLIGRLGGAFVVANQARRMATAGAAALVSIFSGTITERNAQGANADEIAEHIEQSSEFQNFVAPLERLESVCQEFQPELAETVQQLNQPGPTRSVDTCPLANEIVNRVFEAIEEAESAIGDSLPLPPDTVARSLSGCQSEVQQIMDACEEI